MLSLGFTSQSGVQAQGYSAPIPGADQGTQASSTYQNDASLAKAKSGAIAGGAYQYLPISDADAKVKIDELKTLLLVARPQDIQNRIYNLCEWLADLTDAHNKLANAFSRQDSTKAMANAEKNAAQHFGQLKNQAMLLKAELLIKLNRTPEALAPLVDIVVADPKGPTGQAAYRHLKEIGFSPDVPEGSTAAANSAAPEHIMVSQGTSVQAVKKVSAKTVPGAKPAGR